MGKTMLWIGMTCIAIAAILLLGNFTKDSTFPALLGLLGVIIIGSSKYKANGKKEITLKS
jgi:hypothetical protein